MNQLEFQFCEDYVNEMLAIISYPVDDNTVELIEKFRDNAIFEVEERYSKVPYKENLLKSINDRYDRQLFNFIKVKVADKDPEFFKERINRLVSLLSENIDYAKRLGMKVPPSKIDDFYNNYKIALERYIQMEFTDSILN